MREEDREGGIGGEGGIWGLGGCWCQDGDGSARAASDPSVGPKSCGASGPSLLCSAVCVP